MNRLGESQFYLRRGNTAWVCPEPAAVSSRLAIMEICSIITQGQVVSDVDCPTILCLRNLSIAPVS